MKAINFTPLTTNNVTERAEILEDLIADPLWFGNYSALNSAENPKFQSTKSTLLLILKQRLNLWNIRKSAVQIGFALRLPSGVAGKHLAKFFRSTLRNTKGTVSFVWLLANHCSERQRKEASRKIWYTHYLINIFWTQRNISIFPLFDFSK